MILKSRGSLLHYPFEGDATDKWGSNNGTVSGATLAVGKFGRCYSFRGGTFKDRIVPTSIISVGGPFTLLAWFKRLGSAGGTLHMILISLEGKSPSNWLHVSSAGTLLTARIYVNGVGKSQTASIASPTDWHRIGMVWNGSTFYAVLDSQLSAGIAASGTLDSGSTETYIGSQQSTNCTNGLIDEVTIYTRALGIADLKRDMMGLPPIS
jgi:hypothetical protein